MRDFPSPVLRGTFTARELGVCRNDALEMVEAHAVFPGGPRPSTKVRVFTDFLYAAFKAVRLASAS
jgi:hypothetical protein